MNKKSISGLLAVVMIAAVAALNVSLNSQKDVLSDISLENVEAIAEEKGPAEFWCCGNCCTCAKGSGITIHGHLNTSPC